MTKLVQTAAVALALAAASFSEAHEHHAKTIEIAAAWVRPAAKGQNSAAYLTVKNAGEETDTLVSVETPAAEKAELHETRDEQGVMKMQALKEGIAIKPGASVEFKPGSYHIMLFSLKKPLEAGDSVPLTINFAKAGPVIADAKVEKTAPAAGDAMPMTMPMPMHGMNGMDHAGH